VESVPCDSPRSDRAIRVRQREGRRRRRSRSRQRLRARGSAEPAARDRIASRHSLVATHTSQRAALLLGVARLRPPWQVGQRCRGACRSDTRCGCALRGRHFRSATHDSRGGARALEAPWNSLRDGHARPVESERASHGTLGESALAARHRAPRAGDGEPGLARGGQHRSRARCPGTRLPGREREDHHGDERLR
jgi:hypothetical protein